jgi:hypothetical protein
MRPLERIVFWPERDYNPAFVLYEALWMLTGRNDLEPLTRYVRDFGKYSDDGATLHGAYGFRWRHHFLPASLMAENIDQLQVIAHRLRENPRDRRSILAMWDPSADLHTDDSWKDLPCNTTATLQRDREGRLNLTVFCRSNDILWGTYYANAFHFSMLLEYMAHWIGCDVGTYEQISVNYHAYEATAKPFYDVFANRTHQDILGADPYASGTVRPILMNSDGDIEHVNRLIERLLDDADYGYSNDINVPDPSAEPWSYSIHCVLKAHHSWRTLAAPERFDRALELLETSAPSIDWIASMKQWITSRRAKWEAKLEAV